MTEQELFQLEVEGYEGEVYFRTQKEGGIGVTGVLMWDSNGRPIYRDGKVEIREIFAEGSWGRSHSAIGELHCVPLEDVEVCYLVPKGRWDEYAGLNSIDLHSTERGFGIGEFTDLYGSTCSIQESSLATQEAIWLGITAPRIQHIVSGRGWQPVPLPPNTVVSSRMHLNREQAKKLLPLLVRFVETGHLTEEK